MASDRQLEANRRNATRSTGPSSVEGKLISRTNAVKHGLCVQLPEIEAKISDAYQKRRDAWAERYQPVNEIDQWDLDQAVAATFRIDRCNRHVEAIIESTCEHAKLLWEEERRLQAHKLFQKIATNPAYNICQLESFFQGVDLIINHWDRLGKALDKPDGWNDLQANIALDLLGIPNEGRIGRNPLEDFAIHPGGDIDAEALRTFRRELVARELERLIDLCDNRLLPLDEFDQAQAVRGDTAMHKNASKMVMRYHREAWKVYRESIQNLKDAQAERISPGSALVEAKVEPVGETNPIDQEGAIEKVDPTGKSPSPSTRNAHSRSDAGTTGPWFWSITRLERPETGCQILIRRLHCLFSERGRVETAPTVQVLGTRDDPNGSVFDRCRRVQPLPGRGLVEDRDRGGVEVEPAGFDQVVKLVQTGGARDRGDDRGPSGEPGEGNASWVRLVAVGNEIEGSKNPITLVIEILARTLTSGALSQIRLRAVLPGQESVGQRKVRDHPEPSLFAN